MSFSQVDDLYADLTHVSKVLVDHPEVMICMSFSQVGDMYADLIHVSKMLVDQPSTDYPDLFSRVCKVFRSTVFHKLMISLLLDACEQDAGFS